MEETPAPPTQPVPPAGAENAALAEQVLGDVPAAPATPPTPEELAAKQEILATAPQTVPAVPVNDEVNAANPSNVQNAEVNENVANEIAETDAAIQAQQAETENAPLVPPTGPPPPPTPSPEPAVNPSDVPAAPAAEPELTTADLGSPTAQQWVCLTDTGARSGHPPFGSDTHLVGVAVTCPTCGSSSVIRQEGLPQQAP